MRQGCRCARPPLLGPATRSQAGKPGVERRPIDLPIGVNEESEPGALLEIVGDEQSSEGVSSLVPAEGTRGNDHKGVDTPLGEKGGDTD
jgi:hypothetical protein